MCVASKGCSVPSVGALISLSPVIKLSSVVKSHCHSSGREQTFAKGNACPAFRQEGRGQRVLLCLVFLNGCQLKIIPVPMWHIFGWPILSLLKSVLE